MSLPIAKLPSELLSQIQIRMNLTSFCRLRQTCREMDNFIEKNRFRRKVWCGRPKWVLMIAVGEERKPGFDFEITPYENVLGDVCKKYQKMKENNTHWIMDPYQQLSAMMFGSIVVQYYSSLSFFESYAFKNYFLPLLGRLRLECVTLVFRCTTDDLLRQQTNLLIRNKIQFSKMCDHTAIYAADYRPIKFIKKHVLPCFVDMPSDLGSMIRHLKSAIFTKIQKNRDERSVGLLENFLEEIRKDRAKKGNLKYLCFQAGLGEQNVLKRPDSLIDLWKGQMFYYNGKVIESIQLLEIDGGVAIINNSSRQNVYAIDFITDFNREKLIHLVSEKILRSPFDMSSLYEAAMQAPDEKTAVEILCKDYHREDDPRD